jgi:hypothetical protein
LHEVISDERLEGEIAVLLESALDEVGAASPRAGLSVIRTTPSIGGPVDKNPELDDSPAGVQDPLRRPPT